MGMPNDSEHQDILNYYTGPVTDKIIRTVSRAEQRILKQMATIQDKVYEHDQKIGEHEGFLARIRRAFGGVVKG